MKKHIYFFPLILFCFLFCLFACENKKEPILEKNIDSENYKITSYDMDNNFNNIGHMYYFSDNLYISAHKLSGESVICKYNKQGMLLEEIPLEMKKNMSMFDFRISEKGDIFCLITNDFLENLDKQSNFIKLIHFNEKGKKLSSTKLKFPYKWKQDLQDCGLFMEDFRVAILADQKIFLFDQDGNFLNQQNTNGDSLSLDSYGDLLISNIFSSKKGYVFKRLSASSEKIDKEYNTSLSYQRIKAANTNSNYDIIAADTDSIYGYSYQTQETTRLFRWVELDMVIPNGYFLDFACLENDSFAVLTRKIKGEGTQLLIVEPQEKNRKQQEKKELVLYDYYGNDSIKFKIVAWNQQREDMRITIKENVSTTQLALDIVSGKGPDILCLPTVDMFWDSYIKKGYFADYDTLMKQLPEGLQKTDILENLTAIYEETYGGLYFLPISFCVDILAGRKQDFSEKKQVTLRKCNTLMKKYAPIKLINNRNFSDFLTIKQTLFRELFFHSLPDFYNTASGLNVENLKELLDFTMEWTSEENKAAKQSLLYYDILDIPFLSTHSLLKHIETIYGKNNYQLLGYPCETGTGISIAEKGVFAIVANENSSIAWDFVQSFYSYEAQKNKFKDIEYPNFGFPVRKDAFGELFKELKSSENYQGLSKETSATKKEIDMLKSYIEHADRINRYNLINNPSNIMGINSLDDILTEELNAYFDGEKEQEEILPIIENRINLYNKEQQE